MQKTLKVTVSARVPPRTRQLPEAAARLNEATLSRFIALAIDEAVQRALSVDPEHALGATTEVGGATR